MSLNKEIKELDEERLRVGEESRAHYKALDLPGARRMEVDAEEARKRIAAMKQEREAAGQGDLMD